MRRRFQHLNVTCWLEQLKIVCCFLGRLKFPNFKDVHEPKQASHKIFISHVTREFMSLMLHATQLHAALTLQINNNANITASYLHHCRT